MQPNVIISFKVNSVLTFWDNKYFQKQRLQNPKGPGINRGLNRYGRRRSESIDRKLSPWSNTSLTKQKSWHEKLLARSLKR